VFAIKEIPKELIMQYKTYVFFSHVIKGQKYNMPMLHELINNKCSLIDYERIVDKNNRRLIFFGTYAGIAGMVDTLYTLGQRWIKQGIQNPFQKIKKTHEYESLNELNESIEEIGKNFQLHDIPDFFKPIVIGFAGYGNVSKGAQKILEYFPYKEISPQELSYGFNDSHEPILYKVVFKEKDIVQPNDLLKSFDLQDYYAHPDQYHSIFQQYLPYLTVLMNCIYWDQRYPRLITKKSIMTLSQEKKLILQVIGDISVDINGSIEFTEKVTTPDHPSYVYQPDIDHIDDDISKKGVAIMAVDNLPCELPKESSREFSKILYPFIPAIIQADYERSVEKLKLPMEIKNAIILHQGKLTTSYEYLQKFL
jgi:alpha-aminoadipic semialdehyde synthase